MILNGEFHNIPSDRRFSWLINNSGVNKKWSFQTHPGFSEWSVWYLLCSCTWLLFNVNSSSPPTPPNWCKIREAKWRLSIVHWGALTASLCVWGRLVYSKSEFTRGQLSYAIKDTAEGFETRDICCLSLCLYGKRESALANHDPTNRSKVMTDLESWPMRVDQSGCRFLTFTFSVSTDPDITPYGPHQYLLTYHEMLLLGIFLASKQHRFYFKFF